MNFPASRIETEYGANRRTFRFTDISVEIRNSEASFRWLCLDRIRQSTFHDRNRLCSCFVTKLKKAALRFIILQLPPRAVPRWGLGPPSNRLLEEHRRRDPIKTGRNLGIKGVVVAIDRVHLTTVSLVSHDASSAGANFASDSTKFS